MPDTFRFITQATLRRLFRTSASLCLAATVLLLPSPGSAQTDTDAPAGGGEADIENADPRYPLSPFDQVSISVYQQPDLSSSQRISDVGTVALPLIGEVKIAGLTTTEAQHKIAKAYIDQEYLIKPVVTVRIDSFTTQTVTVLGEVSSPGQVALPTGTRRMEIQRIIGMAGDFSDIARKTAVRVERRKPGQEKPEIFVIDVEKITENTDAKRAVDTFYIQPGDILFVPRRAF